MWLVVLLIAAIAVCGWMASQTSVVLTRVVWIVAAVVLAVPVLIRWRR